MKLNDCNWLLVVTKLVGSGSHCTLIIYFRTYEGRTPMLMVHDPELLKSVFVKNHQDFPNRSRRRVNCYLQCEKFIFYFVQAAISDMCQKALV